MKRHPSLHPLSEHHHHVLVQALEIRRAAGSQGSSRQAKIREVAQTLLSFWERSGRIHFREEEEVLLPTYARHVRLDQDPDVMRMLADHAAIRGQMEDLRIMLAADKLDDEKVIALAQMLHDHVRLEEDKIFPRIEEALPEKELLALGPHLTRLHGQQTA